MIYIINEEISNGAFIVTDYSFENIEDHFDDYYTIIEIDMNFFICENTFDCVYLHNQNNLQINYIERTNNSSGLHILMDNYELGCGF